MNKKLEMKIVKKCPLLYRDYGGDPKKTCMAFGIAVGDGWYKIIHDLSIKLEWWIRTWKMKAKAAQVKEKFGLLRFYMKDGCAEMNDLIQEAEALSAKTCEECGKPGKKTVNDMGWIQTLCPKCKGKAGKRLAKIMKA